MVTCKVEEIIGKAACKIKMLKHASLLGGNWLVIRENAPAHSRALFLIPLAASPFHTTPFSQRLRWQSGAVDSFHGGEQLVLIHTHLARLL
jgi:hypothetical protein